MAFPMNEKHAHAAWPRARGVLGVGRGGAQEGKAAVLVKLVTDSRGLDADTDEGGR